MMRVPAKVSSTLANVYVPAYPNAGTGLRAAVVTMLRDGVLVMAPVIEPKRIAGFSFKTYRPTAYWH